MSQKIFPNFPGQIINKGKRIGKGINFDNESSEKIKKLPKNIYPFPPTPPPHD